MEQIWAKTTEWISSKTSTKLEFQTLQSGDSEKRFSWTELARCRVSGHLSVVRRWWPRLSAPMSSTSRHAPSGRLRHAIPSSSAPHFDRLRPRRAPPCIGELSQPLHRVSGQASPPRAPPRRPLPRRPPLSLSRALVRLHCQLRCELHLAGVRRDHRRRG